MSNTTSGGALPHDKTDSQLSARVTLTGRLGGAPPVLARQPCSPRPKTRIVDHLAQLHEAAVCVVRPSGSRQSF